MWICIVRSRSVPAPRCRPIVTHVRLTLISAANDFPQQGHPAPLVYNKTPKPDPAQHHFPSRHAPWPPDQTAPSFPPISLCKGAFPITAASILATAMSNTVIPGKGATASETSSELKPIVNENKGVKALYESWESRIGYYIILGNTRHFGYWDKDTYKMLPVGGPLREMEDKMFRTLDLPAGSQVMDAGCGAGHVALFMAQKGLNITAVDVTDHHISKAKRNVAKAAKALGTTQVTVQKMDYHHLETIEPESHDGVYTMETFVHATNPEQALAGFYRVLRPGGRLVMHEYDLTYDDDDKLDDEMKMMKKNIEDYGAMPTWERAKKGYYKKLLENAGFEDVVIQDYSENIRPMLRLFWLLAAVPAKVIGWLHLEKYFINAVCGAQGYKTQHLWRYVSISASKPNK